LGGVKNECRFGHKKFRFKASLDTPSQRGLTLFNLKKSYTTQKKVDKRHNICKKQNTNIYNIYIIQNKS
jgi:hypothetical protein